MINYVIINGVNSNTIQGLKINIMPPITKPMIRTQTEEIDGRDGDLITELGYSSYDKQMEIGLWGTYDINAIIKYFTGEGKITFSTEPDKYYYFKILDQIDYEKLLKFKKATITFHCQPYKYPVEETPLVETYEYVEETGTEISINTKEAPMGIIYKGNTYQYSTTGKNLIDFTTITYTTDNGATASRSGEEYTVNATGSKWASVRFSQDDLNLKPNTTYTFSATIKSTTSSDGSIVIVYAGGNSTGSNVNGTTATTGNRSYVTFTTPNEISGKVLGLVVYEANKTAIFTDIMLEESASMSTYEPYTNGASPNPNYPQEVHVVSGDNTINVTGKNLFNKNIELTNQGNPTQMTKTILNTGIRLTYTGTTSTSSKFCVYSIMDLSNYVGSTVRFYSDVYSSSSNKGTYYIGLCNEDGSNRTPKKWWDATTTPIPSFTVPTLEGEQKYLCLAVYSNSGGTIEPNDYVEFTNMILTINDENMTYEPYKGASYPINLPVENLFDKDNANVLNAYINASKVIKSSEVDRTIYIPCLPNTTYTISKTLSTPENQNKFRVCTYSDIPIAEAVGIDYVGYNTGTTETTITITTSSNAKYLCVYMWSTASTSTFDDMLSSIQIEKGSKTNSYSEYGTTPIELCKIGTYQDRIFKSSGKNLFDGEVESGNYNTTTGEKILGNNLRSVNYIPITPNTTIKFSINGVGKAVNILEYKEDYTYIKYTNVSLNSYITTTSETKYLTIYRGSGDGSDFWQLEKGSTASEYEPYGTSWYLNKQIGKAILDGTESVSINNSGTANWYYQINITSKILAQAISAGNFLCDHYTNVNISNGNTTQGFNLNSSSTTTNMRVRYGTQDTASNYKTWLSSNNIIVYAPLATPTYTEITDSTLLGQLEAIKTSYEGQTNISQENNDLPFELDVIAMSAGSGILEINNIGTAYAMPTIALEGTGNVSITLNDEQVLQVDMTTKNEITIDSENMDAYAPDETLANRLITGDYNNLKLSSGTNTMKFGGDFTKATVTDYTRWI